MNFLWFHTRLHFMIQFIKEIKSGNYKLSNHLIIILVIKVSYFRFISFPFGLVSHSHLHRKSNRKSAMILLKIIIITSLTQFAFPVKLLVWIECAGFFVLLIFTLAIFCCCFIYLWNWFICFIAIVYIKCIFPTNVIFMSECHLFWNFLFPFIFHFTSLPAYKWYTEQKTTS